MKLFEVRYIKQQLNLNGNSLVTTSGKYQVIAKDEIHAVMVFGQTFHRKDEYEIQITRIVEV